MKSSPPGQQNKPMENFNLACGNQERGPELFTRSRFQVNGDTAEDSGKKRTTTTRSVYPSLSIARAGYAATRDANEILFRLMRTHSARCALRAASGMHVGAAMRGSL